MDFKAIETLLRSHDIKPSHYRMRIFQYLVQNRNHPNIDLIYQELIQEMPTLSKTTLYNTMELFLEKGIVMLISIAPNEMRYDADTSEHGHFRCTACGEIYDTPIAPDSLNFEGLSDFDIHDVHVYLWGICPKCKKAGA
ncbi:MAG: Fur family transcriptional regulator [Candidatus Saccharibacteria bacterium]